MVERERESGEKVGGLGEGNKLSGVYFYKGTNTIMRASSYDLI